MIITVTMNPAIDKTIEIENFEIGTLNRINKSIYDAGGKGINVSKTINAIGGETVAIGFVGGNAGNIIVNTLNSLNIKNDFVYLEEETRTNTKVFANNAPVTELNEQGAQVSDEKLNELIDKIKSYATADTIFVLAGSIPKGVPKDIYNTITKIVKEKGSKVLLDADGELFRSSLSAIPTLIKPNREELSEYANIKGEATREQLIEVAQEFLNDGIETVVISMGKYGSMFLVDGKKYFCDPVDVKVHSTVGAGDAMVAGLAYSLEQKLSTEDTLRLSVATSAGAVTTIGTKPPSKELVDQLVKQVEIHNI